MENALIKVSEFEFQRLRVFNLRRPHITGAVADEQIIYTFAGVVHSHAAIVDSDLLVGFQIVPHEHLLVAAHQSRPHLYRREPVHIDVGDQLVRVIGGDERDILDTVYVLLAGRDHRFGFVRK